ncbi:MAG: carbonic anhydrase [Planctomycetaceae bacterium]|jgi:carbonic anhydrase|nr:carbonic anhydrase [Planctomycetaceae bacterium]
MKKTSACVLFLLLLLTAFAFADDHNRGAGVSPEEALKLLKEGNVRFVAGKTVHLHSDTARAKDTKEHGQHPFATILTCSDSRVSLPVIFDQGIGDIFSIKIAGNVSGKPQLGSIEYGVAHAGSQLVVVLGHTNCGAVTAACTDGGHEGNIETLMKALEPAVKKAEAKTGKKGEDLIADACKENVFHQIETLYRGSEILREKITKKELQIIGGVYDIETGKVEFFGEHPNAKTLLKAPKKPKQEKKEKKAAEHSKA